MLMNLLFPFPSFPVSRFAFADTRAPSQRGDCRYLCRRYIWSTVLVCINHVVRAQKRVCLAESRPRGPWVAVFTAASRPSCWQFRRQVNQDPLMDPLRSNPERLKTRTLTLSGVRKPHLSAARQFCREGVESESKFSRFGGSRHADGKQSLGSGNAT